jgi:hypothetical protein
MKGVHLASRRTTLQQFLSSCLVACFSCSSRLAFADEAPVPISLQVALMLKVAAYDKNLPSRAGSKARVLVLVKAEDADSVRAAAQATNALSNAAPIAGLPAESATKTYADAAGLANQIVSERVSVLYLTPGFSSDELREVAHALTGLSVLSVGALARHASQGTVLAFDLVGGKPKLIVNLKQAQKQNVELSSSVLKLMRVIE